MGFQISRLTDFCKEFDFPCLAFVQLNQQNNISQSDRLRWLCHSFGAYEKKKPEEATDDGPQGGNRKLTLLDTRYGPGVDEGDYICMDFVRDINKITEIGLKSKLGLQKDTEDKEFEVDYDVEGKSEIISSTLIEPLRIEDNTSEEIPWDE